MASSLGRKLSFVAAVATLLAAAGIAWVAQVRMEQHLAAELRKETESAAALLASRMRDELRHLADQAEWLLRSSAPTPLDAHGALIAVTVLEEKSGQWTPVQRLRQTPPQEDGADLDRRFPLDPARYGFEQIVAARLADGTPLLRVARPRASASSPPVRQVLVLEIRQSALTAVFADATAHTNVLLDADGRLLAQAPGDRFQFGEDLSHWPVWQAARTQAAGQVDYREISQGLRQFASFQKFGEGGLTIVSQASERALRDSLAQVTFRSGLIAVAGAILAWLLMAVGAYRLLGARLKRIGATLDRFESNRTHVRMPDRSARDEIGAFAATLQRLCDRITQSGIAVASLASLPNRKKSKAKPEAAPILPDGETLTAWMVVGKFQGLDLASDSGKAPELYRGLNAFFATAAQIIQKHQGVLERAQGESLIACWGIPQAQSSDADRALTSALELRECAKTLNEALTQAGLPQVRFSVGIHRGPVSVGRVGADERAGYLVLGESSLLALRLTDFTAQFGSDILATQPAIAAAPIWFKSERLASADGAFPEIYELTGKSAQAGAIGEEPIASAA